MGGPAGASGGGSPAELGRTDSVSAFLNKLGGYAARVSGWDTYQSDPSAFAVDPSKFVFDPTQQDQTRGQQSQLAQLLFSQANGGGPQLAAAQERSATDRNIAQAYAMAQANPYDPGAARNAANAAAAANQDAAQQSAMLQMQQQLAATGQLSTTLGAQRGQDINAAGQQLTGQMTGEQARINALMEKQRLDQNSYYGAAATGQKFAGGLLNGIASAATMGAAGPGTAVGAPVAMAHGGPVPAYAHGGHVPSISIILPQTYAATGGMVPGHAPVPGNSYANDSVSARLSPGEIVLPRSVTEDEDAAEKAKLFVQAIQKRKAG